MAVQHKERPAGVFNAKRVKQLRVDSAVASHEQLGVMPTSVSDMEVAEHDEFRAPCEVNDGSLFVQIIQDAPDAANTVRPNLIHRVPQIGSVLPPGRTRNASAIPSPLERSGEPLLCLVQQKLVFSCEPTDSHVHQSSASARKQHAGIALPFSEEEPTAVRGVDSF